MRLRLNRDGRKLYEKRILRENFSWGHPRTAHEPTHDANIRLLSVVGDTGAGTSAEAEHGRDTDASPSSTKFQSVHLRALGSVSGTSQAARTHSTHFGRSD